MNRGATYLTLAGMLILHLLGAQQELSLRECIRMTLATNRSVSVYEHQVAIAAMQKTEALSAYLPQINAYGSLDDNIKRQVTVIPAGALARTEQRVTFGNQYNTLASLQADQVLYDQSVIMGIRAARPVMEQARWKAAGNTADLVYATAAAYYTAMGRRLQLSLLRENERKYQALLGVQRLQYDQGVITQVNLRRIEIAYNNVTLQCRAAETTYSMALSALKHAMGVPMDTDIAIADTAVIDTSLGQPPELAGFDVTRKAEYLALESGVRLQEVDLMRKRAMHVPSVNGYARYGFNAFGNDLVRSYDHWYGYSSIGLRVTVPIFSGLRRYSQVRQSELNLRISKENLALRAESMELEFRNARTQLVNYYYTVQTAANNLALAREVFNDTEWLYEKGKAPLADFLTADYAFKEAQSNYVGALLSYLTARIDLERSRGTIINYAEGL